MRRSDIIPFVAFLASLLYLHTHDTTRRFILIIFLMSFVFLLIYTRRFALSLPREVAGADGRGAGRGRIPNPVYAICSHLICIG